jgi:hypothetical protein
LWFVPLLAGIIGAGMFDVSTVQQTILLQLDVEKPI